MRYSQSTVLVILVVCAVLLGSASAFLSPLNVRTRQTPAASGCLLRTTCSQTEKRRRVPSLLSPRMEGEGSNSGSSRKDLMNSREALTEEIAKRATTVSSKEEKASEVGLSQFEVGAGTETLGREVMEESTVGVWGQRMDKQTATALQELSAKKMSFSGLVLDRTLDSLDDAFSLGSGGETKPNSQKVREARGESDGGSRGGSIDRASG
eukprot:766499-Hanusia_phi.AAC.2